MTLQSEFSTQKANFRQRIPIIALLLILFAQLALGARQLSFTSDAPSHIATGYAYLARGTTWTVPLRGHPPLMNALEAFTLYIGNPNIPLETLDGWGENNIQYVQAFVPYLWENVEQAETAARTPAMLLTVLLAAVVTRWAMDLFGARTGLIALVVLMFDPTLLAHGMLATNDAGVTAFGTLGLFVLSRFLHRPSFKRTAITGLVLGLTMLTKGSGILWLGAAGLMMGLDLVRNKPSWPKLWPWLAYGATIVFIALACVWAFYGFEWGTLLTFPFPVPAPTHWRGVLGQSTSASGRQMYFQGKIEQGGRWTYFPTAFLIKNPLPLLVLLVWSLLHSIYRRFYEKQDAIGLCIFPTLYIGAALYTGVNIGYRHLLPIHPFFYLMIAGLARPQLAVKDNNAVKNGDEPHPPGPLPRETGEGGGTRKAFFGFEPCSKPKNATLITYGLLAWLMLESLMIAPHYIAYFNQIIGGPEQGWRYLADSNTDWGQGYKALSTYQKQNNLTFGYSGPQGFITLKPYGVNFAPLPPVHSNPEPLLKPALYPAPGDYVISMNTLSGLGSVDPDNYAWFRYRDPQASIARVLFHYRVEALPDKVWVAQCSTPAPPLDADTITEGFARSPDRHITFDCTQTWIYPNSRRTMGWYALHAGALQPNSATRLSRTYPQPNDHFSARHLESTPMSYRQWEDRNIPAFVLYEQRAVNAPTPLNPEVYPARAETIPASFTDVSPQTAPIPLDGPLSFLGINTYTHNNRIEAETWWRATQDAPAGSFSLMAHLVTSEGQPLDVADGLGIAPSQWETGDIIVQRHQFDVAPNNDLWLRTGAYGLDNGTRWTINGSSNDALFIEIQEK